MKKYLHYFWYLARHKLYVFLECCKYGLYWRGVVHDLSKFLPSEFFPYADYYFGGGSSEYAIAWLYHQRRNRHHWQYWVMDTGNGGKKIFPMPDKYKKEMFCDWHGARKAKNSKCSTKEWYLRRREIIFLHTETREWVEKELGCKDF